jgi:hypothetical protein
MNFPISVKKWPTLIHLICSGFGSQHWLPYCVCFYFEFCCVFRLGLYSNMNITQPLSETMAVLNMQIGN